MSRKWAGIAAVAVLMLAAGKISRSQAVAPRQWEYATIAEGQSGQQQATANGPWVPFSKAYICRMVAGDCQNETVNADGSSAAMLRAASMLGEQGWELVSVVLNQSGYTTMYLRRPKETVR